MQGRQTLVLVAAGAACAAVLIAGAWAEEETATPGKDQAQTEQATDFKQLENPVAFTEESVKLGRNLYLRYCADCHGYDGRALAVHITVATDLTDPDTWYSGTTEGEVFRSIRDGAGVDMPPFSFHIENEEDIWHLVNYTLSLWPEDRRPRSQVDEREE
jgi:mono/diheme cytochrome c family protein